MTRISHSELAAAENDLAIWWRAKQMIASGPRKFGYAQAVKLAVYKFHSTKGDKASSLSHFDRLVAGRLTKAARIADHRMQLEAYIEWVERSGVIVADHRVRLDLPLAPAVVLGGEVSRIDVGSSGYRGVLLGARFPARWQDETRMPLIQLALAQKYDRSPEDMSVAVQLLDGTLLGEFSFGADACDDALKAATTLARRIQRMSAPSAR